MTNWKKKIDNEEEVQRQLKEKEEYLKEKEAQQAKNALRIKKVKEEKDAQFLHQKLIRELGNKFKCHVCGLQAKKPSEKCVEEGVPDEFNDGSGHWEGGSSSVYVDDWDLPGDLWKCSKCRNWACFEHIHKGICQECAEKI